VSLGPTTPHFKDELVLSVGVTPRTPLGIGHLYFRGFGDSLMKNGAALSMKVRSMREHSKCSGPKAVGGLTLLAS
jgi:hypothetical protein